MTDRYFRLESDTDFLSFLGSTRLSRPFVSFFLRALNKPHCDDIIIPSFDRKKSPTIKVLLNVKEVAVRKRKVKMMGETCPACKQFKMLCMCNTDALNTDFERQLARQRALIRQASFTHPPPAPLRRSPSTLTSNSGSNSPAIRQSARHRQVSSMGSRSGSGIFFNKGSNAELIVPQETEEDRPGIAVRKNIHNLHLSVGDQDSSLSCVARF